MKIVYFLFVLLLVAGCSSEKVYKIGILSGLDYFYGTTEGFKEGMTDLGYVEGKNIEYEIHRTNIDENSERISVEKFVNDKVDLILSYPTEPSLVAKKYSSKTPVVFANAPLSGTLLVESIDKPGDYITGVQFAVNENAVQRLELLHDLLPGVKRIWVPYQRGYPIVPGILSEIRPVAKSLEIELIEFPADNPDELELGLINLQDIDAILMIPEPLTISPGGLAKLSQYAKNKSIPIAGTLANHDGFGSLFGFGPDAHEVGKQASVIADKILKGASPRDIPVVTANHYLIVNITMIEKMKINASVIFLARA